MPFFKVDWLHNKTMFQFRLNLRFVTKAPLSANLLPHSAELEEIEYLDSNQFPEVFVERKPDINHALTVQQFEVEIFTMLFMFIVHSRALPDRGKTMS